MLVLLFGTFRDTFSSDLHARIGKKGSSFAIVSMPKFAMRPARLVGVRREGPLVLLGQGKTHV